MNIVIVTGGKIDDEFVRAELNRITPDKVIAADSAVSFFLRNNIEFDNAVGDFDSLNEDDFKKLESRFNDKITKYPSEKDFTDTEIALNLAIDMIEDNGEPDSFIYLYGATGSRIDHVLGNIELLLKPFEKGIGAAIIDKNNRIEIISGKKVIENKGNNYPFFSLLPYFGEVKGLTEKGVKYELANHDLNRGLTLGVSNEIVADEAIIEVASGKLLLVMSRD